MGYGHADDMSLELLEFSGVKNAIGKPSTIKKSSHR